MLRLQKLWIVGIHFRDRFDREIIIRSRVQGERAIAGTVGKIIRSTRAVKTFEHLRHDRIHWRLFEIRNQFALARWQSAGNQPRFLSGGQFFRSLAGPSFLVLAPALVRLLWA